MSEWIECQEEEIRKDKFYIKNKFEFKGVIFDEYDKCSVIRYSFVDKEAAIIKNFNKNKEILFTIKELKKIKCNFQTDQKEIIMISRKNKLKGL
jgi:hypothetical protein